MNSTKFKAWMAYNRIRQKDLRALLGLSATSINKKVNGKEDFTLPQIRTICNAYHVSADIFV